MRSSSLGLTIAVVVTATLLTANLTVAGDQERPVFAGEEVFVNTIEVPVRVVDPKTGAWIDGLGRDDFRIWEDGEPQQITGFFVVDGGRGVKLSLDTGIPEEEKQDIIIFLDFFFSIGTHKSRAIKGLRAALETLPLDVMRVGLVTFDGRLRVHAEPTSDRQVLLSALEEAKKVRALGLQNRLMLTLPDDRMVRGVGNRQAVTRSGESRLLFQHYWHELRWRMDMLNQAVEATLARFAGSPNRLSLVLVTPGYPSGDRLPQFWRIDLDELTFPPFLGVDLMQRVSLQAAELGFTLFAIDPSGVSAPATLNAEYGELVPLESIGHQQLSFWHEHDRRQTLVTATELTGGETLFASDLGRSFNEVAEQLDAYYSIAYEAPHQGDGKRHDIRVELRQNRKAELRYRQAYVDRPAAERQADELRAALVSSDDARFPNPLGIAVEVGEPDKRFKLGAAGLKRVDVPVKLRIPYAELAMVERGEIYWGQARIVILNLDPEGHMSPMTTFLQNLTLSKQDYAEARRNGYYGFSCTLKMEGGTNHVRIAVRDELGDRTSLIEEELRF